jgi:hypothetical protein
MDAVTHIAMQDHVASLVHGCRAVENDVAFVGPRGHAVRSPFVRSMIATQRSNNRELLRNFLPMLIDRGAQTIAQWIVVD